VTILDVQTHEHDGVLRVALRGELDLSSAAYVEEELQRIEADRPPLLALDLSELRFMDSTGLRLVVTADQRARRDGRRFAVVRGPEPVQRVFVITRLEERLEMVDDIGGLGAP
jgi:anti-anti-sigma factor